MEYLDFERPIIELERKLEELRILAKEGNINVSDEIERIQEKIKKLKADVYSNLTPWQIVQIARHPNRPHTIDYIKLIISDFFELHGDGYFSDDHAMICGIGKIDGKSVVIIGQEKGRTTKEKMYRNFGMCCAEGYRKALRVMKLAEKFSKPIICFIDTPGAYPGIEAEERGVAFAIARNIREMSVLRTPIIVVVIGEGGSGGALGIGVGDYVLMQEYAFYSVISPEGCAAILWRDGTKAKEAAEALHLTAKDLLNFGIIDEIIKEPEGGAHRNYEEAGKLLKDAIIKYLNHTSNIPIDELIKKRIKKFTTIGKIIE